MIINGMTNDKRFRSSNPPKLVGRILREVLDALLLIVILISIAFLAYYLQIPREDRPPISDLIPWGTRVPEITHTVTPTRTLVSTPTAAHTQASTVTLRPTATSSPTATPSPDLASRTTSVPTSATRLTVDLETEDGIERGNQVVEAIEAYTRARGFYPATLDDLVPDFLPELPFTISGQAFFYRVFDRTTVMSPEIYWVSFRVVSQSNVTCTFYRRLQYWDCNYSSP